MGVEKQMEEENINSFESSRKMIKLLPKKRQSCQDPVEGQIPLLKQEIGNEND